MKLSDMKTNDELIAEEFVSNPEFRAEWERTTLARAVSLAVLRYRTERGLSQRALGEQLGMKQPQVARLELGEHNPSIETLMRLSSGLRMEFTIRIRPAAAPEVVVVAAQRNWNKLGTKPPSQPTTEKEKVPL
jgi:transcriptional regulator with XRE-family HTH domain